MKVVIEKTQAAHPEAIAALRKRYGELPADYVEFLKHYDGTEPDDAVLARAEEHLGIRAFTPAAEIIGDADGIDGFPKDLIPIAYDEGGSYFCIGAKDHKIYFWDSDGMCEGQDQKVYLRPSFTEFMASLEPFPYELTKDLQWVLKSKP